MRKRRTLRRPDHPPRALHANSIARAATGPKALRTRNARRAVAIQPAPKADRNAERVPTVLPADRKEDRSSADNAPKAAPEIPALPIRVVLASSRRSSPRSMRTATARFPPRKSPTLPRR